MDGERTIAHYKLLEPIGSSAWGEVHRARDTERGNTVALKLTAPGALKGPSQEAFLDDARAAATLSHPNIAILYNAGQEGDSCYLAYEFAAGATLAHEMDGHAMNPRRAMDLAGQIADALADAHARGIIHGDLRPDTVIVTPKGNAKVLDFGMSRWRRGGAIRGRAASHPEDVEPDALRVVAYMSPEQALGGLIDGRTDVFSLGVVLYEMLTGRNPFTAGTVGETILKIVGSRVPPPSAINAELTPDIDALVMRALSKDIEQRPQGAAAFAADLRSAGAAVDLRSSDSRPSDEPTFGDEEDRSRRRLWWVVAIAGLALGAAAFWWFAR